MKQSYRAVVIGGGVVGASVLYHLAKLGWSDIALVERKELTAGSSWHAAGAFHAINADPNIAALQDYTIKLYARIQEESGEDIGLHMAGGVNLAGSPDRWEWLKSAWAVFQTMGMTEARLVTPEEIEEKCPIVDIRGIHGGLYDPNEGHLDTTGTVRAYAKAAQKSGAEVILRNRVLELLPRRNGGWDVVTEHGTIQTEHVVNAGGLWAKQVGRMAGIDLPVAPMQHHYLVTEAIPELELIPDELPLMVDLEGFTYLRQEGNGVLLGVYELSPKHWNVQGAPWDYGMELIPEEIDRIAPELEKGFARYPCLEDAGIRRWVNGAFTFTPDGNPLVGPVRGIPNYWLACGVMAGFAQGGGVGLSLAQWMIEGEPGADIYGMDIGRYGAFASNRSYLEATTRQFYSRRFVLTYPNEQLPAGRPLRTSPCHEALDAKGAIWGESWGLEVPLYFAPAEFEEIPSQRRSNAHDIVGSECRVTREGAGLLDITGFSRFEITGSVAEAWLDELLACRLPASGRARLAPMLSDSGRLAGDLTLLNWGDGSWWLMGSYFLRQWHMRWFENHLPDAGVSIRDISDSITGVSITGPESRTLLARVTREDVSNEAFPFLACRTLDVGVTSARVNRMSVAGELGYEINVSSGEHRALYRTLLDAGEGLNVRDTGYNALLSLRMEKAFGIWSKEYTSAYTPGMSGLDRFIAFGKKSFVGRDAAVREREEAPPARRLALLEIDATDADASGFEPVWRGERRIGFVTSGAYGHCVEKSLALAYLDRDVYEDRAECEVHIVGTRRKAQVLTEPAFDPDGARMRS